MTQPQPAPPVALTPGSGQGAMGRDRRATVNAGQTMGPPQRVPMMPPGADSGGPWPQVRGLFRWRLGSGTGTGGLMARGGAAPYAGQEA
jgi:hypothetical protein